MPGDRKGRTQGQQGASRPAHSLHRAGDLGAVPQPVPPEREARPGKGGKSSDTEASDPRDRGGRSAPVRPDLRALVLLPFEPLSPPARCLSPRIYAVLCLPTDLQSPKMLAGYATCGSEEFRLKAPTHPVSITHPG